MGGTVRHDKLPCNWPGISSDTHHREREHSLPPDRLRRSLTESGAEQQREILPPAHGWPDLASNLYPAWKRFQVLRRSIGAARLTSRATPGHRLRAKRRWTADDAGGRLSGGSETWLKTPQYQPKRTNLMAAVTEQSLQVVARSTISSGRTICQSSSGMPPVASHSSISRAPISPLVRRPCRTVVSRTKRAA